MGQSPRGTGVPDEWNIGDTPGNPARRNEPPAPTIHTERRLLIQETARLAFAGVLVLLLLIVILLGFLSNRPFDQTRELLEIFLPVIGTLLATALTFYFVERR